MKVVDITVNGRVFQVACDDGQEKHLSNLASQIDKKVEDLALKMGQVGDARLILMAGLLVADELSESLEMIDELDNELKTLKKEQEKNVIKIYKNAASRLTNIAASVEKA